MVRELPASFADWLTRPFSAAAATRLPYRSGSAAALFGPAAVLSSCSLVGSPDVLRSEGKPYGEHPNEHTAQQPAGSGMKSIDLKRNARLANSLEGWLTQVGDLVSDSGLQWLGGRFQFRSID